MAPNAGIEIYIGLLVMTISPVIYSQANPYNDRHDHLLMMLTQLAQTVVVLCGMVRENVKGDLADWIVTAVIMMTLCPMFLLLLLYIWDPRSVQNIPSFYALFLTVVFVQWPYSTPAISTEEI
jgi:hypothetical protein